MNNLLVLVVSQTVFDGHYLSIIPRLREQYSSQREQFLYIDNTSVKKKLQVQENEVFAQSIYIQCTVTCIIVNALYTIKHFTNMFVMVKSSCSDKDPCTIRGSWRAGRISIGYDCSVVLIEFQSCWCRLSMSLYPVVVMVVYNIRSTGRVNRMGTLVDLLDGLLNVC